MSAVEPPATAGPTLAISAVLHVFLAQNPELTVLPITWTFSEREGITASIPHRHPDSAAIADRLAGLLGAGVIGGETQAKDGQLLLSRYVTGVLSGQPFFFNGFQPIGGPAVAE